MHEIPQGHYDVAVMAWCTLVIVYVYDCITVVIVLLFIMYMNSSLLYLVILFP